MKRLVPLLLAVSLLAACGPGKPKAGAGGGARKKPPGPEVWMELRRGAEPRELVRIGTRGVVVGPEGGAQQVKLFAEPRRGDEAWYFLRSYAPFELQTPRGRLLFHGQGKAAPGPAEKRMIFEWARQVAAEAAAGGRGNAAYGLVLALHQGGSSGICQDLALYLTGQTVATACGWGSEVRGQLDPAQLGRVYDWFDRLRPFQTGVGGQDPRTGSLEARLVFAGRGTQAPAAGEQAEVQAFAAALFAELAARRPGAPKAIPAPTPTPTPAPAPASTPAPPSRLLLPPRLTPPRPEEVPLQLPDQPPPPPPENKGLQGVNGLERLYNSSQPRPSQPRPRSL
jgi:hypothetical protein